MWAAPREETGVSAAEAALQQQLVVPGQLLLPSEWPAGVEELPVPLVVIPPTVRFYAQAVTTSPLDGADWVYVAKGGASRPMADKYSSPFKAFERGNKARKLQVGERVAPEAALPPTRGRPRTASAARVVSPSSAE